MAAAERPPSLPALRPEDGGRLLRPLAGGALVARFRPAGAGEGWGDETAGGWAGDASGDAVVRLLDLLEALDPGEAALARGCLPCCDSTFGAGLALFLSVTAAGCRGWLPADAVARLEALDDGLAVEECDEALAPRRHSVGGRTWRVVRVPLRDPADASIRPAGLLCATSVGSDAAGGFTVVLQARPATLGAVQLTATLEGRRLDVTLQTAGGLPASLLAELHESLRLALDACRLRGGLTVVPLAGDWLRLDYDLSSDVAL